MTSEATKVPEAILTNAELAAMEAAHAEAAKHAAHAEAAKHAAHAEAAKHAALDDEAERRGALQAFMAQRAAQVSREAALRRESFLAREEAMREEEREREAQRNRVVLTGEAMHALIARLQPSDVDAGTADVTATLAVKFADAAMRALGIPADTDRVTVNWYRPNCVKEDGE